MEEEMSIEGILIFILIGAIAGWLAGQIMKGFGFMNQRKPARLLKIDNLGFPSLITNQTTGQMFHYPVYKG